MGKKIELVLDAADPRALGVFWAFALGYVEEPAPEGFGSGDGPRMYLQRVPEPKTAKNRMHVDVVSVPRAPDGSKDWGQLRAAAADLVERTAVVAREFDDPLQGQWIVMNDPEGNEFCVV